MRDIVQEWIQARLGVLINMSPESFAQSVRDGHLLSQVLRNYELITEDQLQTIEQSDDADTCLLNFKNHINGWLSQLGITVQDDELFEIANSKGTAALNLFHKVYLELNTKTNIHFVAQQRCKYAAPIEKSYDIIHWQQDHLEVLKNKCIQAREEYIEYVKRQNVGDFLCPEFKSEDVATDARSEAESVDLTYDELVDQQRYAKDMEKFVPDPQHESYRGEILAAFWEKVNLDEEDTFNKHVTESLLKQSLYEKQMLEKLGEVKYQKHTMLENQLVLNDAIVKQKDADFVKKLLLREKELDENEFTYYLEKERVLLLHRKIYKEKLRLRAERHYYMCLEAVKDIVNASLKEIEYKKEFGEEPTQKIVEDTDVPEEIIHLEIDRQDRIDEKDFESYLAYEWPWEMDNIVIDDDRLHEMYRGLNVLGCTVHTVLVARYPYPPLPQKPDLANITVSACVNGLPETSWLPVLQKILEERQVLVIEIQDAINFCVNAYKEESKVEVDDDQAEEDANKGKGNKGKDKKGGKEKGPKGKKGEKSKAKEAKEKGKKVDKTVQTPRIYPCEEITLSVKAQLGKTAHEVLNEGMFLTDFLLVTMFVEYLKSRSDIKGWVLINYLTTYVEAALLEEALTGLPVPGYDAHMSMCKSIYDVADLEKKVDEQVLDGNVNFRKSKLLPNPVQKPEPGFYDTALTAFIQAKLAAEDTDGTDPAPTHEELEDEEVDAIDKFYSDLGCNYSYINASVGAGGKKTAKAGQVGDKKEKPKEKKSTKSDATDKEEDKTGGKGKKEDKKNKGKKGKDKEAPVVIVHEDKATQAPEEEEYTDVPFPDDLKIALASFWENAEQVYKEDFQQVFFLKRIILDAIMPFVNYVTQYMHTYISRPDDKQTYLREFQRTYNEFDEDIRNDEEFKAELHCRIYEMKEKLIEMCDRRMMEAEQERVILIGKNWTPRQFIELVNNYISAFQIELDLCVDSLQLLGDYYTGMVTKMPNEDSMKKELLPKLDLDDPHIAGGINRLLQYVDDETKDNPLKPVVESTEQKALEFVDKIRGTAESVMKKVRGLFAPEGKGKKKPPKPKKDKKGKANILTLFEPDDLVKQNSEKIFEEWACAIKGETIRVALRLDLLKADLFSNLDEITETTQKTFHDIFDQIRTRYQNEVASVTNACKVLTRAVEEEVKVQEELFLKDDNFFIDPDSILFTDKVPPAKPLAEFESAVVFTAAQLDKITDVLLDLAPSGYITRTCFLYLVEDLVIAEDGPISVPETWKQLQPNEVNSLVARLFDDVEYTQWRDFILYNLMVPFPNEDELFCMRKIFREYDPDSTELITDYQFLTTPLWFEDVVEDEIRAKLLKLLLIKLYRVRGNRLNYTAMLLDLSKDENPVRGFAKALGVSLGKPVCWDKNVGEQFAAEMSKRRKIHEEIVRKQNEEHQDNVEMTEDILTDLVDHTVHVCDSVVIEDIVEEAAVEESFQEEVQGECGSFIAKDYGEMVGEYGCEGDYDFTNISINFEVEPGPSWPLSWHAKVQNVEDRSFRETVEETYEECRNPEFNGEVLAHEFLNHPRFLALIATTSRFSVRIPPQIVEDLLAEREANEASGGL
ncbi:hypothetical protein NQ318_017299 [Aromia moschata]|uniref:Sperm flagellar protein 2 n=1 Tax=Aromia moschata TaxID=1265417 RepID=A0AAV8XVX7_9CUCU|nr:hypothetical protein NQ318_017299 [Aromia moschata]